MTPDLQAFVTALRGPLRQRFDAARPVLLARAPGRLDAFGGIIDYTGGTVCEIPLGEAVGLAYQPRADRLVRILSQDAAAHGLAAEVVLDLDQLAPRPYDALRDELGADPATAWARYVAGAWTVLVGEGLIAGYDYGAEVAVTSDVPFGAGVSSSAALEMATLAALTHDLGLRVEGQRLARLGQIVENHVVGAPCGLMDQLTVTLGEADAMLVIRCQPDEILGVRKLPAGVHCAAIHTGVKHSVGGGQYTAARVAAFMGHAVLLHHARRVGWAGPDEDPWAGYLARVPFREYELVYRKLLPAALGGAEFLATYGGTVDPATTVLPAQTYRVLDATDHQVYDNHRAPLLLDALAGYEQDRDPARLVRAGELLLASHASYRDHAGLGAAEADLLVDLVMARGPAQGLYGAKITGGGCGGSVAILGDDRLPDLLPLLAAEYAQRSGERPTVMFGSSPGVLAHGVVAVGL